MLTLSPHRHFMGWPQGGGGGEEVAPGSSLFLVDDPFPWAEATDTSYQFPGFSSPQPPELVLEPDDSFTSLAGSGGGGGTSIGSTTKKHCHNAYERDRRKKLNDLYSSLRSLLPDSVQNNMKKKKKKKLSIPVTISLVLKYIPELQRRVERLRRRKEEIVSALQRVQPPPPPSPPAEGSRSQCVVSASLVGSREAMVQLCLLNKDQRMVLLSRVLKVMEEEEGVHLVSISTGATTQDDRFFCSIHLQGREALRKEDFCEHLIREIKEQARADSSFTAPTMFVL